MATHQKAHIKNRGPKDLVYRDEKLGEQYAEIINSVGEARFECKIITTNVNTIAKLAGRLIKGPHKQRIIKGDMVLLSIDSSTSGKDKYFIMHKYSAEDKKKLAKHGEFATVKSVEDESKTTVIFEDEIDTSAKITTEVEIDEDFIDDI
jgi:translation initiation factor IF-1